VLHELVFTHGSSVLQEVDFADTVSSAGHIRTWDRPKEGAGSDEGAPSTSSASNA
jgi:hypothetical protein